MALLLVCCCASFVPLPYSAAPAKDSSVPYPCMNRPCGCDSAEQCWRSCCCFTNQQKVTWAKKNSVVLPSYVVDAAKKESLASSSTRKPACPHCVESSQAVVHETRSDEPLGLLRIGESARVAACVDDLKPTVDCCESASCESGSGESGSCEAASGDDGQDSASGDVVLKKSKYLYGISVQKCRGLQSLWQILSMSMMPELAVITDSGNAAEVYVQFPIVLLWEFERDAPEPPPRLGQHRRAFAQWIG
ncbi:MAG: hypothetical protein ABJZ55_07340 [Fuerstiella sp.]